MSRIAEVILVLVVVLVLVGLIIPAVYKARESAAVAACRNNLKQIALATHNYAGTYGGRFPQATMKNEGLPPEKRLSWLVDCGPFLESDPIWRRVDKKAAWDAASNHDVVIESIKTYLCPAIDETKNADLAALTCYVGLTGVGTGAAYLPKDSPRAGMFGYDRITKFVDIKDGLSTTIMVMETDKELGPWAAGGAATTRCLDPDQQPFIGANGLFGSKHMKSYVFGTPPTTANAGFADGSVRNLTEKISPQVLEALATIAGGEDVDYNY